MAIDKAAIIIIGASGNLARLKLIPALANLFAQGEIGKSSIIIGCSRTDYNNDTFRKTIDVTPAFKKMLFYHRYIPGLKSFIEKKGSFAQIIFFLALPPHVYIETAKNLFAEGFKENVKIILEKPFGYNFKSARKINSEIHKYFSESQIYRIDHYLAKEAVQNILIFRFANSIFYPVWNSRYIESIQINAIEKAGIEDRGAYFDKAGILRDMVQNHLTQLLALITMEAPISLNHGHIREQKKNILQVLNYKTCHRYQYEGYQQEKGVAPDSLTETYAELKLIINNFRWTSMPVYIRVGKALNRKGTEIGLRFKNLPRLLFNQEGTLPPNIIVFKIQPDEGIILDITSKLPGTNLDLTKTNMKFCYREFYAGKLKEAYNKLLLNALKGDKTLFVSSEETEISWQKIEPFLDKGPLHKYKRGVIPKSFFNVNWIDFDKYSSACD